MTEHPVEPVEQLTVRIEDALRILSIGRTKLNALCRLGDLERLKIGSRSVITVASIRAYVERLRAQQRAKEERAKRK